MQQSSANTLFEELKKDYDFVVGSKSVLRAIASNKAKTIFLAKDIDNFLAQSIINAAQNANVIINMVDTRAELASLCQSPVKTAAVAFIKQQ